MSSSNNRAIASKSSDMHHSLPGKILEGIRFSAAFLSKRGSNVHPVVWMIYDAILAALAVRLAYIISPKTHLGEMTLQETTYFVIAALLCANVAGMYEKQLFLRGSRMAMSLLFAAIMTPVLVSVALSFQQYRPLARYIFVIWIGLFFLFGFLPRFLVYACQHLYPVRVLLAGEFHATRRIARKIRREKGRYEIIGYCVDEIQPDPEVLGCITDIPSICSKRWVDHIVLCGKALNSSILLENCFEASKGGCTFSDACTFYEGMFEQVSVDMIDEEWFLRSNIHLSRRFQSLLKRGMDIFLSLLGLVLLAPVIPVIYLLIRITSPGPAFYTQTRLGQYGRPFRIFKFRTMTIEAEKDGAKWASKGDARVTHIGYILRKTRLDEVPQFFNILKGDMSFVGPRPERPEMMKEIEKEVPFFSFRCWARPGLTGLAQIRAGYGASVKDAKKKLQFDLFYIKNWSILLDMRIIMRTITAIMRGAR
ncbi:MAG: sugar transferase [Candidatus Sumerlaeia bacterium]